MKREKLLSGLAACHTRDLEVASAEHLSTVSLHGGHVLVVFNFFKSLDKMVSGSKKHEVKLMWPNSWRN